MNLVWDPSPAPGIVGYNVYSGVASKVYSSMVSYGNVTAASISGLTAGTTYFFSVTAVDASGLESPYSNETTYTPGVNTPPTISNIPNQIGNAGTALSPLSFAVADAETPASNLAVTASSSNPVLLPSTSIVLSGGGTNRAITLTPAPGQVGTTTIALTVCDQSLCATTSFVVSINPPPAVTLSAPVTAASFTAPATISLAAAVTANGHSITKVQFFNGTALLGETSSAPWTFTWNNVAAGSYNLAAVLAYDAGTLSSAPVTVTVGGGGGVSSPIQALPAPWQVANIGNPGLIGSATISNDLYSVQGAGNLSGLADNFCFLYQSLSGDGEIQAQITSAQNTGNGDCVGGMIRESLNSGSKYALMGLSPGGAFRWQRRSSTGGNTSSSKAGSANPPDTWARLVRTGNTLAGYKSNNGTNWTLASSSTITMATNIYIGFVVASGNTNRLATCWLENVAVVP